MDWPVLYCSNPARIAPASDRWEYAASFQSSGARLRTSLEADPGCQAIPGDNYPQSQLAGAVVSARSKSHDTRKDQLASSLSQRVSNHETQTVRLVGSLEEMGSMPLDADHLQSKAESQQRSSSALKSTCTSRLHPF